jgi:hypothetical protein
VTSPVVIATPLITLFSISVNVVAVPISTIMAVSPYSSITEAALATRSAPTSLGLSTTILTPVFTPGPMNIGLMSKYLIAKFLKITLSSGTTLDIIIPLAPFTISLSKT